ncbi:hypothetical protein KUCAC02_019577 [Chaenocephalus aceratus]|uniref:Uncharacterized protein n=1 Tax=Chaenocephalus aceratus TaxID=36190 RepID=A0ACB9VPT8_CHAAC|nr:hypothetical protein KUCAC02_019577 [Chaenocephalus aceratus]
MQCGLAFSKAGQCRIASLRKELHHKEKEDRGGGEGQRSTIEPAEAEAERFSSGRVLLEDPGQSRHRADPAFRRRRTISSAQRGGFLLLVCEHVQSPSELLSAEQGQGGSGRRNTTYGGLMRFYLEGFSQKGYMRANMRGCGEAELRGRDRSGQKVMESADGSGRSTHRRGAERKDAEIHPQYSGRRLAGFRTGDAIESDTSARHSRNASALILISVFLEGG